MGYTKVVQSGDLVEVYHYQYEPSPKRIRSKRKRSQTRARLSRRSDNIAKCRLSFRRLVRSNLLRGNPAMLTLTMLDDVGIAAAYKCFTSFGRRIRKRFGEALCYVAVPEFQKRGAVHFHALIWGLPDEVIKYERYTRDIQNTWGWGYVDIVPTDGHAKLAGYLAKYMSKAMHDYRLRGKRAYTSSRNVLRSASLNTPFQIALAEQAWGLDLSTALPLTEREYGTIWLGRCLYKQFIVPEMSHEDSDNG